jgi:hypothetical protein
MRTDTKTFANRVYPMIRKLGINPKKSRILASQVVQAVRYGSYNPYAANGGFTGVKTLETFDLSLVFSFSGGQFVQVEVDGALAFTVTTSDHELVSCEPTPVQLELGPKLEDASRAYYSACSEAVREWDAVNGYPASNEEAEVRFHAVGKHAAVIAARAAYDLLRDESLASNPYAHINYIDPMLFGEYSDCYKDETGCRPRGHIRYSEAVGYFDRFERDAANENQAVAAAAA